MIIFLRFSLERFSFLCVRFSTIKSAMRAIRMTDEVAMTGPMLPDWYSVPVFGTTVLVSVLVLVSVSGTGTTGVSGSSGVVLPGFTIVIVKSLFTWFFTENILLTVVDQRYRSDILTKKEITINQ